MRYPDPFTAQLLMEMRVEERLRRAEIDRQVREAGVRRRGWLSRQGCWLLCQVGRLLVAVGARLQERYQVPSLSLKEQAT
jgi:hypothetical protein